MQQRMKPATSGAAVPPSPSSSAADNSAGRRQHRAPSPARAQEGAAPRHPARSKSPLSAGRSKRSKSIGVRSADGREREPESHAGAAVHPDGAEADLVRPNRADAVGRDLIDSAKSRRSTLRLPCLQGDSNQRKTSPAFSVKEKGRKPGEGGSRRDRSDPSAGCTAGLGLGLWRGGCLQAELIHFHLQKRLKRSGAKMHSKADGNGGGEEAAHGEPEPAAEATEAGSVTQQQDQAFEDEMERLLEENEDLKVCHFATYSFFI